MPEKAGAVSPLRTAVRGRHRQLARDVVPAFPVVVSQPVRDGDGGARGLGTSRQTRVSLDADLVHVQRRRVSVQGKKSRTVFHSPPGYVDFDFDFFSESARKADGRAHGGGGPTASDADVLDGRQTAAADRVHEKSDK